MTVSECYSLGFISKTQGYKGLVIAFLDVDYPEDYRKLDEVYIELNNRLVPFFIEQFTLLQKGYVRLKLQDVDNEFEAGRLVNARLYLPLEVLPDLGPDKFYYHEIIGFMLLDKTLNEVGKIIEVMDIPGNPQAICKVGEETVYIPLSDYFYCGIDKTKKEVYVDLPDGLVDVNLGDAGKDA